MYNNCIHKLQIVPKFQRNTHGESPTSNFFSSKKVLAVRLSLVLATTKT